MGSGASVNSPRSPRVTDAIALGRSGEGHVEEMVTFFVERRIERVARSIVDREIGGQKIGHLNPPAVPAAAVSSLSSQQHAPSFSSFIPSGAKALSSAGNQSRSQSTISRNYSSVNSGGIMISTKSLRALALRQHSRQENTYIPQENVFPMKRGSSGSLNAEKSGSGSGGSLLSSTGGKDNNKVPSTSIGVLKKSVSNSSNKTSSNNSIPESGVAVQLVLETPPEAGGRKRPNLKINIQDDIDWIQVSDDDGGEDGDVGELSPRNMRPGISTKAHANAQQSYLFTQSGTIFIDGFNEGIGKEGIISSSVSSSTDERGRSKLPMRERLLILCRLGQGASSVVYKALDLHDMRLVALKMISVFERNKRRQMVRELNALFQTLRQRRFEADAFAGKTPTVHLPSPTPESDMDDGREILLTSSSPSLSSRNSPQEYIVDFFDAFSNIDEGGVCLMMEYMDGGSLQDIVDHGGCNDENTLANIAHQALQGLSFLHGCSQLHRDLKPGNFLISRRGDVKVADLGIVRQMDREMTTGAAGGVEECDRERVEGTTSSTSVPSGGGSPQGEIALPRVNTFVGTATYMSPERIDGRDYSYPSDVWAFGLSLMSVALGRLPIDTQGGYWTILHSIRDSAPPKLPENQFSEQFNDFLGKCLQQNPADRHTCQQLLQHPFLSKISVSLEDDGLDDQVLAEVALKEVRDIVTALYLHLLKTSHRRIDGGKEGGGGTTVIDDLRSFLLGGGGGEQEAELSSGSRLITLANQLHLSIEDVVTEVRDVCGYLSKENADLNLVQTPKAAYNGGRSLQ